MKKLVSMFFLMGIVLVSSVQAHEMQHGFVLSRDDQFGSHLVATGHHSQQAEITGSLIIEDKADRDLYQKQKSSNADGHSYFLFQAQNLNLPTLNDGQILTGHIIESPVGKYDLSSTVVKKAQFKIKKVILNIKNPFFGEE